MKRTISLMMALVMALSMLFAVNMNAFANVSVDGKYEYSLSGNKATITRYCGSETSVHVPGVIDELYDVVAIGRSAFFMNLDIEQVTLPDSVESIGESAFHDCHALASIDLGNGLKTISKNAFYNCYYLESIDLPASVESIGADAFKDTERLSAITVASDNNHYTAVDNVLFTKDMTALIRYAAKGKNVYVVPDGVTTIASSAFFASGVKDITLPTTLTLIDTDAFDGNHLQTVRYNDYESAWNEKVTINNENDGNKIFFDESVTYVFKTAHVHTPAAPVKENEVPATCKDEGSYDEVVYCSECGEEISREAKTTDKTTDHTPGAAVKENEIKATYKQGGSYDEVIYCSVCGTELSREHKTTPKLVGKNGWYYINGKWYLYKDNEMLKYWHYVDGKWYYMNSKGEMVTGWLKADNVWYYLGVGGDMATGWRYISGKWYFFNNSGVMQTGWLYNGGKWYYLNANGDMATGWRYISGKWYYLDSDGVMLASTSRKIGGKTYSFNSSGACTNP